MTCQLSSISKLSASGLPLNYGTRQLDGGRVHQDALGIANTALQAQQPGGVAGDHRQGTR